MSMPSRLAVLLFTDLVDSTGLKNRIGTAAYVPLIGRHNALFEDICARHHGEILDRAGDGFFAAFATASDAVRAALSFQQAVRAESWGHPMFVRLGMHLGEVAVLVTDNRHGVVGVAADLAARVTSLAAAGQILLTRGVFNEARQFVSEHPPFDGKTLPPLTWVAHGPYLFKGVDEPVEVFEVGADGLAPLTAPAGAEKAKRVVPHDQEQTLGWRPAVGLPIPGRVGWLLDRKLGEGGFGEVWLGRHDRTKQKRAFKFCFDADRLRSFKRELTLFRLLRDALGDRPDIAKLYEVKLDEPPFFLESDYSEGGNLIEWSTARGGIAQVPIEQRIEMIAKVSDAVAAAHSVGILHKDIKPSNILVSADLDASPQVRLADFGIGLLADRSQLAARNITETGFTQITDSGSTYTGTRLYAPPELLEEKPFTIQSDVYSLGILLYQMVIGDLKRPLAEGWARDVSDELLREDIASCVEGDPQRRLASAGELATRLRALPARRDARAREARAHAASERRRMIFRASLAGAVIMAVVTSLAVIGLFRERGLQRKTEAALLVAEDAKRLAERESILARRAAAQSDAHLLLQQHLLPAALARATEAFKLGGEWEDGMLLHEIAASSRRNWLLSARVMLEAPADKACISRAADQPCLVISDARGLRAIDARTGAPLGSLARGDALQYLLPAPEIGAVLAVSESAISLLSLPQFTTAATRSLSQPLRYATASGSSVLLLDANGSVRLLRLLDLTDVESFDWGQNPLAQKLPSPNRAAVSPNGKLALIHGGNWTEPYLLWDRRSHTSTFKTVFMRASRWEFIDDSRVTTSFSAGGSTDYPHELHVYSFANTGKEDIVETDHERIPNDDTKGSAIHLQAWVRTPGTVDFIFVGSGGLVLKRIRAANDRMVADRFANLLPAESTPPIFLAADGPSRTLALRRGKELLLFRRSGSAWTDDWSATVCRDGLLYVHWSDVDEAFERAMRLEFVPFDCRRQSATFSLQWPVDSKWFPWSLAATADASTVAVIAQETDSDNTVGARRMRIRALVYRPGSLSNAPSAWPIAQTFQLDVLGSGAPHTNRFASMDPSGHILVYWTGASNITRYDMQDGKPLGELEVGGLVARSRDGRLFATATRRDVRAYDLASGQTVFDVPTESVSGLCFSADGLRLVVADAGMITVHDIASRKAISSIRSELQPLAYPSEGNRFLAFQRDSSGSGGSIILADAQTGRMAGVISRTGQPSTPAFFSDAGREIAIVHHRWSAAMVRSLRPEEVDEVLNAGLPPPTAVVSLPPLNVVTTAPVVSRLPTTRSGTTALASNDLAALREHMGKRITVQGQVAYVSLTAARDALNIEMADSSRRGLLVWVPRETYAKLSKLLGQNPFEALHTRTIRVSGRLATYGGRRTDWQDRLQITLDNPSDLFLVSADDKPSATQKTTSTEGRK